MQWTGSSLSIKNFNISEFFTADITWNQSKENISKFVNKIYLKIQILVDLDFGHLFAGFF